MRDKLALHQYVLFGVLIFLLLFKLITGNFILSTDLLWWLLGAMLGFIFVFTDRFIYSFLMKPDEAMAMRLKDLFGEKKFTEGMMMLLSERHEQKELMMRSFLFLVVWVILALLTVTSISNPFGRGFMLGIGTHLVFDLVYDYYLNQIRFNLWFWQIKREVSVQEKRWFVMLMVIIFCLLVISF